MDLKIIYGFLFNDADGNPGSFTGFLTIRGYNLAVGPKEVYECVLSDFQDELKKKGVIYVGTPGLKFLTVLP